MDKISPVSTNLLYAYKPQASVPVESKNNSDAITIAPDIVKKETADAAKAYAIVAPKEKAVPEKKSIDELKADLISQGKVEGKDFTLRKGKDDSQLNIIENGKIVKVYRFMNNGEKKEDFDAIQEFSYPLDSPKGLKHVETMYGADGEFRFRTFNYDKDNSPYINEDVNCTTKSSDFKKYLRDNDIKFANDIDINNDTVTQKYTVYDKKSNQMIKYEFIESKDANPFLVIKSIMDENGNVKSSICFNNSITTYTEYEDTFKA